jgi:hypothetical protein
VIDRALGQAIQFDQREEAFMQITLPDEVRLLLEERARRAGLKSVEEYVLAAVLATEPEEVSAVNLQEWLRECLAGGRDPSGVPQEEVDQRWREIEAELVQGLESGPAIAATPEFWAERRRVLQERTARRQSGSS